jgi:hypothetical protein
MAQSSRRADFVMAAVCVVVAIVISPIGIRLITGRLDLSPRVTMLSLTFGAGLLIVAAAALSWGRIRHGLLLLLVTISPLLLIAAVEAGAVAVRLADRVAPLEDLSTLANKDGWPGHFMSDGRKIEKDGLQLYRAWHGDGIAINELGLRTLPPAPKMPGEWRIAVTGGSVAFGWRVRDADAIPVQMQEILHRQGFSNVTVYNFGLDAAGIADELRLLKRFRETYGIDQVAFLTGANDVTSSYMSMVVPPDRIAGLISGVNQVELLKFAGRLKALWLSPSSSLLAQLDTELLPALARGNSLRDGLLAADQYCRDSALRCDFVLQPVLLRRKTPVGPEIRLDNTLRHVYPRYGRAFEIMYRTALEAGPPAHDLSDFVDRSNDAYFIDVAHLNEAGNRQAAERIARIVSDAIPSLRSHAQPLIIRR